MNTRSVLILSAVILVMMGIIAAGVVYLYSGIGDSDKVSLSAVVDDNPDDAVEFSAAASDAAAGQQEGKMPEVAVKPDTTPAEDPAPKAEAKSAPATSKQPSKAEAKAADPAPKHIAEFSVKNSKSGKQNTLAQNRDFSIELIDQTGQKLWSMDLDSKIAGTVAQIDLFKNNKIQFLFAAGTKLHLVDRLGREVEGFPLVLPGSAKGGPDKVQKSGKTYWSVKAGKKTVYADLNDGNNPKIITELPK